MRPEARLAEAVLGLHSIDDVNNGKSKLFAALTH